MCGSQFADIFNVDHFITSLRDEVRILKELPPEQKRKAELESIYSMYPLRWVSLRYYLDKVRFFSSIIQVDNCSMFSICLNLKVFHFSIEFLSNIFFSLTNTDTLQLLLDSSSCSQA